jgi:cob(I)alamin adenosyltransferase
MAPSKMTTRSWSACRYVDADGSSRPSNSGEGATTPTGYRRAPGPPERRPVASGRVATPRIYTKRGDDGTTGLLYGGRVRKDSWRIELNGVVDEAQAAIGLARAETAAASEANDRLTSLAKELYVLMAEVATAPENRSKLQAGSTLVTADMVAALEAGIDDLLARVDMPSDFTVPGENRVAAALDLARTIVRRAERLAVAEPVEGSLVVSYLNRLSDLLWAMARWQEGPEHTLSKA